MTFAELVNYNAGILDATFDAVYGYGLSKEVSFGREANLSSARCGTNCILNGKTDVEEVAKALHYGWGVVALGYDDPIYGTKPEKKEHREKLAKTPYTELSEEEKEKDRVGARALLRAQGIEIT